MIAHAATADALVLVPRGERRARGRQRRQLPGSVAPFAARAAGAARARAHARAHDRLHRPGRPLLVAAGYGA